ncbi:hypothetical protein, partial [Prosthecobacter algae]|uniref:hypothetical protein n=1 Tax=Prosthecobacter algae TaxID=1144682 RepID=UPI0031EB8ACE
KALLVPETKIKTLSQTKTQTQKRNRQRTQDSHKNWLKLRGHSSFFSFIQNTPDIGLSVIEAN